MKRQCFACLQEFTNSDTYAFLIMVNSRNIHKGDHGPVVNELPSYMLCYRCTDRLINDMTTDRNRKIEELVERENKE